jgi:enamine deaminase RidA (YjgF/YER057c/UK114 family)
MQQKNPPARIAIGVSALPLNSLVEVSATFKLK